MSLATVFGNRRRIEAGCQARDVVCSHCRRTRMPYDGDSCPCGARFTLPVTAVFEDLQRHEVRTRRGQRQGR